MLMHFVANAGIFESPSFVPSSLASVAVAPGSLITIYGQGLGSIGEYDVADTTKIVTQLGNTQVYLDGHIARPSSCCLWATTRSMRPSHGTCPTERTRSR